MNEKKKNKKKKRKTGLCIVGSFMAAVGAVVLMPKVVDYLSEKMYSPTEPSEQNDDDWGPEIVKRDKVEETESSEKEDTDGKL